MNRTSICNKLKQDCVTNNSNSSSRTMAQKYYGFKVNSDKGSSWGTIGSYDYKNRNDGEAEDLMGSGFPWPPRNYTCSFCKREFRSAQALGGHMNVHRRDRARLRQYSPPSEAFGDYDNKDNCNNNSNNYDGLQVSSMNLSIASFPNPNLNSNPTSKSRFMGNSSSTFSSSSTTALFASSLPLLSCPISDGKSNVKKRGSGDKDVCGEGFRKTTEDLIQMRASSKGIYEEDHRKSYMHDKECDQKRAFVRLDLEIGLASRDDHQCKEEMELDLELRLGYY